MVQTLRWFSAGVAVASFVLAGVNAWARGPGGGPGFVTCAAEPEGPTCNSATGGKPCAVGKTCQTTSTGCNCQ